MSNVCTLIARCRFALIASAAALLTLQAVAFGQDANAIDPNVAATTEPTTQPTSQPAKSDEPSPLWWGAEANSPTPGVRSDMLSKLTVSIVLVGVLGVIAWIAIKKLGPRVGLQSGRKINVVENVYLGPKKCLHLVEIDGQRLLLGSTAESVSMLSHLQPAEDGGEVTFRVPGQEPQDTATDTTRSQGEQA
jgi:flagellar biogenesis protein FliO